MGGQAIALQLRGLGYQLKQDYPAAIASCREAIELWRALAPESQAVASGLMVSIMELLSLTL